MANNPMRLPSGSAGITNYADEYKSRFMLSPAGVLVYVAIIIVFAIVLRFV
jgi:hypothetical protein